MEFTIKNVPLADIKDEECIDLDVAVRMEMIAQLMHEGKMPSVVDFDDIADIEF